MKKLLLLLLFFTVEANAQTHLVYKVTCGTEPGKENQCYSNLKAKGEPNSKSLTYGPATREQIASDITNQFISNDMKLTLNDTIYRIKKTVRWYVFYVGSKETSSSEIKSGLKDRVYEEFLEKIGGKPQNRPRRGRRGTFD